MHSCRVPVACLLLLAAATQRRKPIACRKLVGKADFHTLWELLQWFPRDYFDYRPAHEPWEDGAAIKGVGRVLYRGLRGTAAVVDIAVDVGLPAPPDDGGYFDEPGKEEHSDGAQNLIMDTPATLLAYLFAGCAG